MADCTRPWTSSKTSSCVAAGPKTRPLKRNWVAASLVLLEGVCSAAVDIWKPFGSSLVVTIFNVKGSTCSTAGTVCRSTSSSSTKGRMRQTTRTPPRTACTLSCSSRRICSTSSSMRLLMPWSPAIFATLAISSVSCCKALSSSCGSMPSCRHVLTAAASAWALRSAPARRTSSSACTRLSAEVRSSWARSTSTFCRPQALAS
mmetsp:Transcript_68894/g.164154  ORF Transcript_68894/g.164154 Transcript_68894/m.164154 type:complete len:203 (-) Transcript_68894:514-1122(-)